MNIPHLYSIAFALVVAMIIYDEVRYCHDLPWPPRFIAAGMVFGLLDIGSLLIPSLTGVMAIGLVLAIILCTIENELVQRGKIGQTSAPCGLGLLHCSEGHDCGTASPAAFNQATNSPSTPNQPPMPAVAPGLNITGPPTAV